jgi:cytochrome b561
MAMFCSTVISEPEHPLTGDATMANEKSARRPVAAPLVYSLTARKFHWWTAGLVLFMLALGKAMDYRANHLKIFDGTTNTMFSVHKLVGFIVLWVVLARFVYRLRNGAPATEPGLEKWQIAAAHATHWMLYLLLILVPLGGWLGVSLYGARDVFGIFSLPPIASVNQKLSETVFMLHGLGATLIFLLVAAHISGALYHHVIRKDGVLRRMWPSLGSAK